MWKIKGIISKGEYNYAIVPEHPKAIAHGYVLEHRIIMENHLGRLLLENEVVHHINGNKKDNNVDNLRVMDKKEHARLHGLKKGRKFVDLVCPQCKKRFTKYHSQTHLAKGGTYTSCSRACSGKFSRDIQLHGITHKVESAITGNIVRIYSRQSRGNC